MILNSRTNEPRNFTIYCSNIVIVSYFYRFSLWQSELIKWNREFIKQKVILLVEITSKLIDSRKQQAKPAFVFPNNT